MMCPTASRSMREWTARPRSTSAPRRRWGASSTPTGSRSCCIATSSTRAGTRSPIAASLRQLHDGVPDVLLHDRRGRHRPRWVPRRAPAVVGLLLHGRLQPHPRRRGPHVLAIAVSAVDDAQAGDLVGPVRQLGVRRLRPLHHLVPGRDRHHRGGARQYDRPTEVRTMRTIDQLIAETPTFAGLAPEHLEFIAGCAWNERVPAGTRLLREGEPADRFYLIRHGTVALEFEASGPRAARDRDPPRRRRRRLVVAVRPVPLGDGRPGGRGVQRHDLRRRLPAGEVRGRPRARLPADEPLRPERHRAPPEHQDAAGRCLWTRSSLGLTPHARADGARGV